MDENGREQSLDVLGHDVAAAVEKRPRARGALEREAATNRAPDDDGVLLARRTHELDDPAVKHVVDVHVLRRGPELVHLLEPDDRLDRLERVREALLGEDAELVLDPGIARAVRRKKRSSCASGSGNVPSYSIGFSVAMRRNGYGSSRVTPSTVTWRSAIASSSADWVFGVARLISSTRTTLAKIGPGLNSKPRVCWSKTESPVTSVGCRSGVHWIRCGIAPSMLPAIARARTVFAVPGTSSRRTWPSHASAVRTSLISLRLP